MFFSAVLALALRTLLAFENRKLEARYGGGGGSDEGGNNGKEGSPPLVDEKLGARRDDDDDGVAVEDYGPRFRYVL